MPNIMALMLLWGNIALFDWVRVRCELDLFTSNIVVVLLLLLVCQRLLAVLNNR